MAKFVDVVCGLIILSNRILLTQRPSNKPLPYLWECPGGKVEVGEAYHAALIRELKEELNIDVVEIGQAPLVSYEFDKITTVHLYRVGMYLGIPAPQELQGIGWFKPEDLFSLPLMPSLIHAREKGVI
jgi:8-oxo-dGTP diphosphatase